MKLALMLAVGILSTGLWGFCSIADASQEIKQPAETKPAKKQPPQAAETAKKTGKQVKKAPAPKQQLAPKQAVIAAVSKHFRGKKDHQPTDLIRQADAEAVLAALAELGYSLDEPAELVGRIPADNTFLQRALSGASSRKFMRKLGKIPDGYANFQLIATLPGGEQTARRLISDPGGEQMVRYLATTGGGAKLGAKLAKNRSRSPGSRAKAAKQPPIYSANQLATVLLKQLESVR